MLHLVLFLHEELSDLVDNENLNVFGANSEPLDLDLQEPSLCFRGLLICTIILKVYLFKEPGRSLEIAFVIRKLGRQ